MSLHLYWIIQLYIMRMCRTILIQWSLGICHGRYNVFTTHYIFSYCHHTTVWIETIIYYEIFTNKCITNVLGAVNVPWE